MAEVSQPTQELVSKYLAWKNSLKPREGINTIHVDEVALRVAAFYEQVRTIIDWKEEHLMLRAAIIRKLKRRFIDLEMNNFSGQNIAEPLVMELIRGGYYPNDKIEETKIGDIQKILNKYVFILKSSTEEKKAKSGLQFYNQLLEIAACEIEESLVPSTREMALIDYMYSVMHERIKVSNTAFQRGLIKPEEVNTQIYIAVQQALFKFDPPIISYNLLHQRYPYWNNPTQAELTEISQNIKRVLEHIGKELEHPLAKKFYAICEKYDTPYLLLGDILTQHDPDTINEVINNPAALETGIKEAYKKRLGNLKTKIRRAAIYSTVSIFVTKMLSLVILEVILDRIFNGQLSIVSLGADVLIPTLLMATLVMAVKPPSPKNLNLAILETMKIVYKKDKPEVYEIKLARKRGVITRLFLSFIYLLGACISFGAIIFVFLYFRFPITSIVINLIFIALILFAGTAIQKRSQELTIEEESEGFLGFVSDILFLPIAGLGRWMSNTWKQYNAIAAFFNAMIDMPFSVFVEFLERWRYFIQEKKEELR